MTEMGQLEENTKKQYATERLQELSEYMARLLKVMDDGLKESKRWIRLMHISLLVYILTVFFATAVIEALAWLVFLFTLLRLMIVIYPRIRAADAELDGVFETLRILGLMNKDDTMLKRKQKMKRRGILAPIKEAWEESKARSQKKAYG